MKLVFLIFSVFISVTSIAQIVTDTLCVTSEEVYIRQDLDDSTRYTKFLIDSSITRHIITKLVNDEWKVCAKRMVKNGITIRATSYASDGSRVYQHFTDEGQLYSIIELKKGLKHGDYTVFYPSGAVKERGGNHNNIKDGEWVEYFEDGSIHSIKNYIIVPFNDAEYNNYSSEEIMGFDVNAQGEASLKNGVFIEYSEDGELMIIDQYEMGRLKK